jgi:pimeloyl-ACP methyl ester carboxylesterase
VRTFSLNAARGGAGRDGRLHAFFEQWHARIDTLTADVAEGGCPLIGVSFGGVVALTYAAARPERVSQLILVSTPAPGFRLDPRQSAYLRHPALSLPLFAARATGRLAPEIMAGLPTWPSRCRFAVFHALRTLISPASPRLMAAWAREWMATDFSNVCQSIAAPTMIVTGEPHLDRVVPVGSSLEYLQLIPGSHHVTLTSTGHLGLVIKPQVFAEVVSAFITSTSPGSRTI